MKEELKKFLDEKKEIIWIKTRNGKLVKEILKEYLSFFEEKSAYCYSEKKVINLITEKDEKIGSSLYEVLDNLYPLGIKKIPIYLLIEDSYNELVVDKNINYLKEIYDTRQDSSRFNFTVIIVDKESLIEELKAISGTIEEKEKPKTTPKDWIEEYIINYADDNNLKIKSENFEEIFELLKKGIKKVSLKNETKEDPFLKNMVFVKGGKYKPSFASDEKEVFDIEVCKYQTTQKIWTEIMKNNPSNMKGGDRPVETVSWWETLEFCNKLSEKYGLEPVYDLSYSKQGILKINQIDEESISPEIANFKKTEGFRLPTEVEWEWFAKGGDLPLIKEKITPQNYWDIWEKRKNNVLETGWGIYESNSGTHNVGLKKPNQLGLYDCLGNVWEWCYDTIGYLNKDNLFYYLSGDSKRRLRGCSWNDSLDMNSLIDYYDSNGNSKSRNIVEANGKGNKCGFRVVRTATNHK